MITGMGLREMGDIMRKAREARPETQEELSYRSGVSQGWISQVELGHVSNPSAARVRAVADALGIDARALFAAQFDIPFGDGVEAKESPALSDDPIALAEQIAALTDRLTRLASARKSNTRDRPSRTSAGA
jgi:transcriptional regulator with XRE-family HTH domain